MTVRCRYFPVNHSGIMVHLKRNDSLIWLIFLPFIQAQLNKDLVMQTQELFQSAWSPHQRNSFNKHPKEGTKNESSRFYPEIT